ncbi:hypothetical protein MIC448_440014 [Microbacterium sp. C448]|nr:hypothetical protein MIC448_440014 [Microbacterium sp. C448]
MGLSTSSPSVRLDWGKYQLPSIRTRSSSGASATTRSPTTARIVPPRRAVRPSLAALADTGARLDMSVLALVLLARVHDFSPTARRACRAEAVARAQVVPARCATGSASGPGLRA